MVKILHPILHVAKLQYMFPLSWKMASTKLITSVRILYWRTEFSKTSGVLFIKGKSFNSDIKLEIIKLSSKF